MTEKEILLQDKIAYFENELKEFSYLQKKVYSERLQKSIVGLESRIQQIKKCFIQTENLLLVMQLSLT